MRFSFVHRTYIFILVLSLPSVFAQKVKTEYDHDVNFSAYRKYEWKEHPFLKNHPESKQFTVATNLVRSKANEILMKRGYEPVEFEPEFYITQFITAGLGQDVHSVPYTSAYPNAYRGQVPGIAGPAHGSRRGIRM